MRSVGFELVASRCYNPFMELVSPSITYKNDYLEAINEGKDEVSDTRLDIPKENESFIEFVQRLNDYARALQLPEGWVPFTELWLIDNGEFIGRVSIRHILTEYLRKENGHIGYYIRPSKRNMGYGKIILTLALSKAKELGINKVLVTSDETNTGSKKIIEANGGVLENRLQLHSDRPATLRYWISL